MSVRRIARSSVHSKNTGELVRKRPSLVDDMGHRGDVVSRGKMAGHLRGLRKSLGRKSALGAKRYSGNLTKQRLEG